MESALKNALRGSLENIDACSLDTISVRRHKPGKRMVVEYEFSGDAKDSAKTSFAVIGKARYKGLDMATWRLNQKLYTQGFNPASADGIQVPAPLGLIKDHHMWLQDKIDGRNPFALMTKTEGCASAERIAQAIHKLHSSDISVARSHSLEDELGILQHSVHKVIKARPEWQQGLEAILASARRLAGSIPAVQAKGIHRDFYHDQILIDKDNIYLLDLDLFAMGDPALDIGNFVAHIQEQCLREFGDPLYAAKNTQHLVDAYCELSGSDIRASIEIYVLLTMVRHIFISQRIASRRAHTEAIMEYCESRLTAPLEH